MGGEITGVLILDVHANPVSGVTAGQHVVKVMNDGNKKMISGLIIADLTAIGTDSTLIINKGTWNGAAFTPDAVEPRLCAIAAPAGLTVSESIMYTPPNGREDMAYQFITTGDGDTKAHVRSQGKLIQVNP
jgi:hypothetical protein